MVNINFLVWEDSAIVLDTLMPTPYQTLNYSPVSLNYPITTGVHHYHHHHHDNGLGGGGIINGGGGGLLGGGEILGAVSPGMDLTGGFNPIVSTYSNPYQYNNVSHHIV